jgi:hypothetical protein
MQEEALRVVSVLSRAQGGFGGLSLGQSTTATRRSWTIIKNRSNHGQIKRIFAVHPEEILKTENHRAYRVSAVGVLSKLKCPLFITSEMSGLRLIPRSSRSCGKVGIPRCWRDFQASWESLLLDFSNSRLFHSSLARSRLRGLDGHTLRGVTP